MARKGELRENKKNSVAICSHSGCWKNCCYVWGHGSSSTGEIWIVGCCRIRRVVCWSHLSHTQVTVQHSERQSHPAPTAGVNRGMSERAARNLNAHTHGHTESPAVSSDIVESAAVVLPARPGELQPRSASAPALRLQQPRHTSEESFPVGKKHNTVPSSSHSLKKKKSIWPAGLKIFCPSTQYS